MSDCAVKEEWTDLLVNTHRSFPAMSGSSQMQETSVKPSQTMDVAFKSQTVAFASVWDMQLPIKVYALLH